MFTFNFKTIRPLSSSAVCVTSPDIKDQKQIYFSGLNGLRALAATTVFFVHVEMIKYQNNFDNLWSATSKNAADKAVVLFFVLSGFLITYLLLSEKEVYGKINVKSFYLRRVLRIWPLYYLFVLIGALFIDFNNEVYLISFFLYLFFLPNVSRAFLNELPFAGMSWSVGVEEQFYLIWPHFFKNSKTFIRVAILVVILTLVGRNSLALAASIVNDLSIKEILISSNKLLQMTSLSSMAIGGLISICVFSSKYQSLLQVLTSKSVLFVSASLILCFVILNIYIPYINNEVYAILFALFIVSLTLGNSFLKTFFELYFLNFLGKISYGIYMFNLLTISLSMFFFKSILGADLSSLFVSLCFYLVSYAFTILIAYLSYRYFESKFLKYKDKFQQIKSGDIKLKYSTSKQG